MKVMVGAWARVFTEVEIDAPEPTTPEELRALEQQAMDMVRAKAETEYVGRGNWELHYSWKPKDVDMAIVVQDKTIPF